MNIKELKSACSIVLSIWVLSACSDGGALTEEDLGADGVGFLVSADDASVQQPETPAAPQEPINSDPAPSAPTPLPVVPAPTAPVSPSPATPVDSSPETPVSPGPTTPANPEPITPDGPTTPIDPGPATPVEPGPVTPINPDPVVPADPGPTTPVGPDPATPVDPGPTTPVNPGPTTPVDPGPTTPVDPGPTTPVDPSPTTPVDPGPTTPVDPDPTTPVDPGPTTPVDPGPTTPVDPGPTTPVDPNPTTPTDPSPTPDNDLHYKPEVMINWQLQLQGTLNTSYAAGLYIVDLFDTSAEDIASIQSAGPKVICYFSAGTYEDWRPDAARFDASDLGSNLDNWPGERWLDINSSNVRSIMTSRLNLASTKGCDGVDPDNVDGYSNATGFDLTAEAQSLFNRVIAVRARGRGLAVGLKNNLGQASELASFYDFAVNESCDRFDECDLLDVFIAQGKPVLHVEYRPEFRTNPVALSAFCQKFNNKQFSTVILPVALDDSFRLSCQ